MIIYINLREFACATEHHPWDVRVKVGSERKFALSVGSRCVVNDGVGGRGGSPKLAVVCGGLLLKVACR